MLSVSCSESEFSFWRLPAPARNEERREELADVVLSLRLGWDEDDAEDGEGMFSVFCAAQGGCGALRRSDTGVEVSGLACIEELGMKNCCAQGDKVESYALIRAKSYFQEPKKG
jgi:hypothetical protein